MSLKKRIVLLLLAALLLCGCTAEPAEETRAEIPQTQPPAEEVITLYDAGSEMEKATNAAVRTYALGEEGYTGLISVGDKVLLVSKTGELTLLQGEDGQVIATAETDLSDAWSGEDLFVSAQNIGYYAADTQETVILDHALQEAYRHALPEEMQGKPIMQLEKGEIFYCTTGQIRAIDIQSGVSRMVRSHSVMTQELLGSYFDDTILGCRIMDQQGEEHIIYLDAVTGQALSEDYQNSEVHTCGAFYYAVTTAEEKTAVLFGSTKEERMLLNVAAENLIPVLQIKSAIDCSVTEEGLQLSVYDLVSGAHCAEVVLPGLTDGKVTATDDGFVWILSGDNLYRWDPAKTPTEDETVYTQELFTADAPDAEGLALCAEKADQLSQTYGLTLKIWEDAAKAGQDYGAVAEYRVLETQQALTQLEDVLKQLPAEFMKITGDVRVYLVKDLADGVDRALHWANGACHIFITNENTLDAFLWGLGNAVDTRVLGNSFDYDKWDDLNPWWFEYTYDYEKNLQRSNPEKLLEGSDRYFTDLVAMSFPTEDRSRLFANALLADNAEMFESSAMQKKLRSICIAVREAYGWEDSTEVYSWEQYLKKPVNK